MSSLLFTWTTRGVKYESRQYLASISMDLEDMRQAVLADPKGDLVDPDMPFADAIPILTQMRGTIGGEIEYGCFNFDGTLIENPNLRFRRRSRNILYYMIRDFYNISRGVRKDGRPPDSGIENDPVPDSPKENWAVLLSKTCPYKKEIERALQPLVKRRSGKILTIPKLDSDQFCRWLVKQFNKRLLPPYLLICDSFENIHLEYQFLFNAFCVTGRLWFDHPDSYETYVQKVLALEHGRFDTGGRCVVASPVDDTVTYADHKNIIIPILAMPEARSFPLEPLLKSDFDEKALLEAAGASRFLGLYCHGVALRKEDLENKPGLQGAFVLQYGSREDAGLLTPNDVAENPFVPGGIVFSPACLAGGTQQNSDFADWVKRESLAPYLGEESCMSAISRAMLSSPQGPSAALLHFDISMASNVPMFNPMTKQEDLQKDLHLRFIRNLALGQTLGRATAPFRWAAGVYYAQAIYIFGQIAGTTSYNGDRRKTIGQFVNAMNLYHVIATDMRNFIILGDPAVRLPR